MSLGSPLRRGAVASAILLATMFGPTAAADGPTDIADARFAALNGPMAGFVVRPDAFGMDATKVLADVPALLDEVDGARAKAFVESIAFPRTSAGPASARQQATDLVADTFRDAGYDPQFQSVVLGSTGNDMPNVSVEVPGTQCSDKVLVVSAHYDSITAGNPAADDDGSGMAGLFEIAAPSATTRSPSPSDSSRSPTRRTAWWAARPWPPATPPRAPTSSARSRWT